MATRAVRRLAIGVAVGLALLGGAVSSAFAQEYTIYLYGHAVPLKASFYAEEPPWIFFRDDDSQYVFAVGCDRLQRVERDGAAIPPPPCPVERLPTMIPQVYGGIMESESKRLEDTIAKLREQIRNKAVVEASAAATGGPAGGATTPSEQVARLRQYRDTVDVLEEQIRDTRREVRLTQVRVGALVELSKTYPKRERQRFYFFQK
jgi:hypothetical protein